MMDIFTTLLLVAILWPLQSWSRILLSESTAKLSIVNLLLGALFGYLGSEFVSDSSIVTWIAIVAIFSAYRSRKLYPKPHLIISTTAFVLAFYGFYVELVEFH
jgi:hypothetical protein